MATVSKNGPNLITFLPVKFSDHLTPSFLVLDCRDLSGCKSCPNVGNMFNLEQITYLAMIVAFSSKLGFLEPQTTRSRGDPSPDHWLQISQLSMRDNWFKFQISGKLPIIFEEISGLYPKSMKKTQRYINM